MREWWAPSGKVGDIRMIRKRSPFHFIKCLRDYISPWGMLPPLGRSKHDYAEADRRSIFSHFIKKKKKNRCSEVRHRLIGGECRYGREQNHFGFWRRKKRGHGESQRISPRMTHILIRFFFLFIFLIHINWQPGPPAKNIKVIRLLI